MRMQVILDSSFARPGSAPIGGGKKGEFRDWTKQLHLGAGHLTLKIGGWFSKTKYLEELVGRKEMHAAQMKSKKFLHCCKQEKKMLQSYFIIPGVSLQNPSKTATIPDNLQAAEPLWLAY